MAGAEHAGGFLMAEVVLYGTRLCPYCIAARRLLRGKGVEFHDIAVDGDPALRRLIAERSGRLDPLLAKVGEAAGFGAEQVNGKEHKP